MNGCPRLLIDPLYTNFYPFHLIPRMLAARPGSASRLFSRWRPRGPALHVRRAYGPGLFDGMDLGFTYTGILDKELNLRDEVLDDYQRRSWPIHAFHATFGGGSPLFFETQMDLTEDTERTRRGLRNQVLAAQALKGKDAILVVHLGRTRGSPQQAFARSMAVLGSVLPPVEEHGITLAIENMPRCPPGAHYLGSDYRELRQVLGTLRSPQVKVCLDWGHANNYSRSFAQEMSRRPIEAYVRTFGYCREMIDELGPDIVYAHVHYNRSHRLEGSEFFEEYDEHMPLTRIPEEERGTFKEVITLLVEKTSIRQRGLINLELIPRRLFGFYKVFPTGSTRKEQLESARLLRQALRDPISGSSCSVGQ